MKEAKTAHATNPSGLYIGRQSDLTKLMLLELLDPLNPAIYGSTYMLSLTFTLHMFTL